ncbi:hypothetical protein [Actinoplanes sp. NPDC020271]
MESIFLADDAEEQVSDAEAAATEQPAVPKLIFLESAGDAGVCGVDGVCD